MSVILPNSLLGGLVDAEIGNYFSNFIIESPVADRASAVTILPNGASNYDVFGQNNVGGIVRNFLDNSGTYLRADGISDDAVFTFSYCNPVTSAKDIVIGFSDGLGTDIDAIRINNKGNIGLDVSSIYDWGSTVDMSGGDATLGLRLEAFVAADVDETQFSHKVPIKINGNNYYLMLIAIL